MSGASSPTCPCSLVSCGRRILGNRITPEDIALLEQLDKCTADDPMFEAHMRFEEDVLGPRMRPGDLQRLVGGHAFIRSLRERGIMDFRFVERHAAWEREIFPTLG